MKWLFTFFFICFFRCNAQDSYSYTDSKALRLPKPQSYSTAGIAKYINENFTSDKEKIRAVYTWVIHNIAYSKDSIYHFNRWGIDPEINMNAILRRRKGVCENYAALFANILLKSGLNAVVVTGYTSLRTNNYWNGHGWVAVQVDNGWYLCDPTWDAGTNTYRYFLVEPNSFINTHMPFDPLWQLLEHPLSHTDFQKGRRPKKDVVIFDFQDSIAAYLQADTLQQMQDASRRMRESGFDNEEVKTWYAYNQMKVHIVQQEENMQLFNQAVDNLNKAKKLYNEFVEYRNNQFTPLRTDGEINALFSSAISLTESASQKAEQVGKKAENYQYDTDGLKESLDALKNKIKIQEVFWKQYLAGNAIEKKKVL